jgi:response regulator NasT
MPGLDGIETARAMYQQQPIAILLLTAVSDVEIIERAATVPIQGYLVKPVIEDQLLASIEVAYQRFRDSRASDVRAAELESTLQARELVDQAKTLLMNKGYSHTEAERQLLRLARDKQITLQQAAEFLLGQEG